MGRARASEIFPVSERQYIQASQSERNLKQHMTFTRDTPVGVCLSIHHTLQLYQNGASWDHEIFTVGCHKLASSFRILEMVQDRAKVTINQL